MQPQKAPPSRKAVAFVFGAIGVGMALVIGLFTYSLAEIAEEAQKRSASDRRSQADIERIVKRVVRVEDVRHLARRLERTCQRFPTCALELDRAERRDRERQVERDRQRRDRRDEGNEAPRQRADRPPRTVTPPDTPGVEGDGGDDPPDPPGASTPSTPPASPSAPKAPGPLVELDPPPVDIDGPDGLLPQLLPDVNLPSVDIPPIRVP